MGSDKPCICDRFHTLPVSEEVIPCLQADLMKGLAMTQHPKTVAPEHSEAALDLPNGQPFTPLTHLEHLLKVAGSVTQDAGTAWAAVWDELKPFVTPNGQVKSEAAAGFAPSCGWPEFVEKFWMIKYYLDSVARVCTKQH
jgi:hypothetical protein